MSAQFLGGALKQVFQELTDEDHVCGSDTEWAPLEEFPYSANAGHTG
jgi:hypothetical protein